MNSTDRPNNAKRIMPSYEPEGITLKVLIAKAISNWKWFVVLSIFGVTCAFFYYKLTPPYYKISSTILVKNDGKSFDLKNVFNSMNSIPSNPVLQDQVGVLKSYNLNFRTLQYFNWRYTWYLNGWFVKKDLYGKEPFDVIQTNESTQTDNIPIKITPLSEEEYMLECEKTVKINGREHEINFNEKLKFGELFNNQYFQFVLEKKPDLPVTIGEEYILTFNNINLMALKYKEKLEVKPVDAAENSNLINVELVTSNLARDVDYLNQLGKIYIQFGLDEKNRMANNTIKFIDDQITGVDRSLQLAGDQFSSFRSRNRTVDLGQEATSVVDKMKTIEAERSALDTKLDYYNNLKFYLDNRDQNKDLVAPSIVGVTDDALSTKVLRLNELYTKREVLSYTAQERNPVLIQLNSEISYTQKTLRENVDNLIANTKVEIQSLNERQRSVTSELSKLPKTEQDLIGIKRTFDLNNELYTFLLQRRAEAEIAKASNNPDAQILDPTDNEIAKPMGPILALNLIIGLLGGLIAAFGLVVVKEFVSEVLTDVDDITTRLDVAVIGEIGINKYETEAPVYSYPKSALTESFRGLRINLAHFIKTGDEKVLGVHSYMPGEGKTFVAVNLSIILAMSDKRVLLVDADLRKPRLHKIVGIENEEGLSNYLGGYTSVQSIIKTTSFKNLDMVPSGATYYNSAELLNSGKIKSFIDEVRQLYDFVIIDNSPYGIVYDPLLVGANTDFNLVLLRLNHSKKEEIYAINKLGHEGILKKVMVAVNGVKQNKGNGYYTEDSRSNSENTEYLKTNNVDGERSEGSSKADAQESTPIVTKIKELISFQAITRLSQRKT